MKKLVKRKKGKGKKSCNRSSGKMGKRKFKKEVKKLGKKYGQDSVLTQTKKLVHYQQQEKGGLGKSKNVKLG